MQRVISGVVLAAAAVAAILFLPFIALRVLACVVAALAAREYLIIAGGNEAAAGGPLIACWMISGGIPATAVVVAILMIVIVVLDVLARDRPIGPASAGAFATVYIGMPLGMLAALHGRYGWKATLFLLASIVVSDSMQYYTGRAFGRHPLAPAISPKKTIEGAIGGVVFGAAFVVAAGWYLFALSPRGTIALGALVVTVGILGDLFESRLKRAANMKDSSNLIPGHGGVLDRIDALLFATPVFYLYFNLPPYFRLLP